MCMANSHIHENSKDYVYLLFCSKEEKRNGILDFKVRMGDLQIIEEEGNNLAGTFLLGDPKTEEMPQ